MTSPSTNKLNGVTDSTSQSKQIIHENLIVFTPPAHNLSSANSGCTQEISEYVTMFFTGCPWNKKLPIPSAAPSSFAKSQPFTSRHCCAGELRGTVRSLLISAIPVPSNCPPILWQWKDREGWDSASVTSWSPLNHQSLVCVLPVWAVSQLSHFCFFLSV